MAALFLASASPRRIELLQQAGVAFARIAPGPEDDVGAGDLPPVDEAVAKARIKAQRADPRVRAGCVLGADTVVALDGVAFNKPRDRDDARRMLTALSGREHEVVTAVAVVRRPDGLLLEAHDVAHVRLLPLTAARIEAYLDGGEWQGKAGAYAIQGEAGAFVAAVRGRVDTVVGLPVPLALDLLHRAGCR